jgi:hypothetical protein
LESKLEEMMHDINEFGLDINTIQEFLDKQTLQELHTAIQEYKKNKNGSLPNEIMW